MMLDHTSYRRGLCLQAGPEIRHAQTPRPFLQRRHLQQGILDLIDPEGAVNCFTLPPDSLDHRSLARIVSSGVETLSMMPQAVTVHLRAKRRESKGRSFKTQKSTL